MDNKITQKEKNLAGEYQKWALNYVTYLYFADSPQKHNSKIYDSATTTFIDTGKRKIAVTNYHVIEHYERLRRVDDKINFQIGSEVITDVQSRIIDKSSKYDLVTYEISEKIMSALGKQWCSNSNWPPKKVKQKEVLVFAGYPGIFRRIVSKGNVYFESVIILEEIISVSPDSFKIHLDIENYSRLLGHRKFDELKEYGGFSGAGIFRLNNLKQISTLEPVGIIYEGSNEWKIQIASHIDVINDNGTIK